MPDMTAEPVLCTSTMRPEVKSFGALIGSALIGVSLIVAVVTALCGVFLSGGGITAAVLALIGLGVILSIR